MDETLDMNGRACKTNVFIVYLSDYIRIYNIATMTLHVFIVYLSDYIHIYIISQQ
jgi:hypothetical protein